MAKNQPIAEGELVLQAIEAVTRQTGLPIRIDQVEPIVGNRTYDAFIEVKGTDLIVEAKKWAPQANLGAIVAQIREMPRPGVLVADYVNPNMAEELRRRGIQFMDTAGNAYLEGPDFYVLVKGNRPDAAKRTTRERTGRAFSTTGLKVVYAFLCDPEMVDAPYRHIAAFTNVAVGTIGWVLNDLKQTGFVRQRGRGRRLVNCRQLLDRWVEAYPERLKRKQKVGTFAATKQDWWKGVGVEAFHAYWGGEIAGAELTGYLRPEVATVYVEEGRAAELVGAWRLRKADDWAHDANLVEIYRQFWIDFTDYTGFVHPVLAYADLIATARPRNIEAAKMIWETKLNGYLGQD